MTIRKSNLNASPDKKSKTHRPCKFYSLPVPNSPDDGSAGKVEFPHQAERGELPDEFRQSGILVVRGTDYIERVECDRGSGFRLKREAGDGVGNHSSR